MEYYQIMLSTTEVSKVNFIPTLRKQHKRFESKYKVNSLLNRGVQLQTTVRKFTFQDRIQFQKNDR